MKAASFHIYQGSKPKYKRSKVESRLVEAIVEVFEHERTGQDERAEVARMWMEGDSQSYIGTAQARGLLPIALLTASLVDTEQLVFAPGGNMCVKTFRGMAALILQVESIRASLPEVDLTVTLRVASAILADRPVGKWRKTVDKLTKTVDNSVEKHVDKMPVIHMRSPHLGDEPTYPQPACG